MNPAEDPPPRPKAPEGVLVDVIVAGLGGYGTHRIPGTIRAGDGSLLASCEGRPSASVKVG